ncbi:hypothetical protein GGX14DRAFT_669807 [Mycena pura]|uniref:Uncharacterized protein n=1 Tax=Mycena pura TaxID=153505 RepID=A0AAD6YH88_9AGAR|nr:hypothetical protein GGX14DRAFT_669807 [Mycena pura]
MHIHAPGKGTFSSVKSPSAMVPLHSPLPWAHTPRAPQQPAGSRGPVCSTRLRIDVSVVPKQRKGRHRRRRRTRQVPHHSPHAKPMRRLSVSLEDAEGECHRASAFEHEEGSTAPMSVIPCFIFGTNDGLLWSSGLRKQAAGGRRAAGPSGASGWWGLGEAGGGGQWADKRAAGLRRSGTSWVAVDSGGTGEQQLADSARCGARRGWQAASGGFFNKWAVMAVCRPERNTGVQQAQMHSRARAGHRAGIRTSGSHMRTVTQAVTRRRRWELLLDTSSGAGADGSWDTHSSHAARPGPRRGPQQDDATTAIIRDGVQIPAQPADDLDDAAAHFRSTCGVARGIAHRSRGAARGARASSVACAHALLRSPARAYEDGLHLVAEGGDDLEVPEDPKLAFKRLGGNTKELSDMLRPAGPAHFAIARGVQRDGIHDATDFAQMAGKYSLRLRSIHGSPGGNERMFFGRLKVGHEEEENKKEKESAEGRARVKEVGQADLSKLSTGAAALACSMGPETRFSRGDMVERKM